MSSALIAESGLRFDAAFARDRQLYMALVAAPLALVALDLACPGWAAGMRVEGPRLLAAVLWQPLIEELLFRGFLQGWLSRMRWGQRRLAGIGTANFGTSILFVLAHLVHQPPWWAVAVFIPSLVFGHFRDRHGQIYPSIVLHAAYNATFLLAVVQQEAMT